MQRTARVAAGVAVLLILAAIALVLVPPYSANWKLQRYVNGLLDDPATAQKPREQVRASVIDKAASLGIRLTDDDVQVAPREAAGAPSGRCEIDSERSQHPIWKPGTARRVSEPRAAGDRTHDARQWDCRSGLGGEPGRAQCPPVPPAVSGGERPCAQAPVPGFALPLCLQSCERRG